MLKFIVKTPYEKQPEELFGIDCDPTLPYELYLYSNQEKISFDDVWNIFLSSHNKTNYLGAMSLIYFVYYKEFYEKLKNQDRAKLKRRITKFKKNYLLRWVDFINYSDDAQYPQNQYIRLIYKLLT